MNVIRGRAPSRADRSGQRRRPAAVRAVAAFGSFWWEFLVGDTPELFVGAVVVLGATGALCVDHGARALAAVLLPVALVAVLGLSLLRAARGQVPSGSTDGQGEAS